MNMKEIKMRTFKRFRTLKELKAVCKERGWKVDDSKYQSGSDHVSFKFKIKTLGGPISGVALFNTFNGRIFGHLKDGRQFSSDSAEFEDRRWFKVLLETAYTTQ
jgi:hypothetical protein